MLDQTEILTKNNNKKDDNQEKLVRSIRYHVKIDNHFMKCSRFYLVKDDEIIYMAKLKSEGDDVHLKDNNEKNGTKIKRDCRGYNIVKSEKHEFTIRYLKYGEKFAVCVSFPYKGEQRLWHPKKTKAHEFIKEDNSKKYIKSKKNIILENTLNHSTFILRKMSKKSYEIECHKSVAPIIIFSIALSQIIGPIGV